MKFMHSCREVARAVSSDELSELPLGRRLLMRWHLLMCRDCMRYSKQIEAIGRAVRGYVFERDPDVPLGDIECDGEAAGITVEPDRLQSLEATILDDLLGGAGEQHRRPG